MFNKNSLILLFLISLCLHANTIQKTAGIPSNQKLQTNASKILTLPKSIAKVIEATQSLRRRLGKKKAPKCPKPEGDDDLWKTWHGGSVKKPCSKDCKVYFKLTDYLKE